MQIKNIKRSFFSLSVLLVLSILVVQVSSLILNNKSVSAQVDDQGSGWAVCNGWATDPEYNKVDCRAWALDRARGQGREGSTTDFYELGLPLPPSGIKDPSEPGATDGPDQAWYNWGNTVIPDRTFLSEGTSCGMGPSICTPPTSTPSDTPTSTPTNTVTPSVTPSFTPTPTMTLTPTPTSTTTVTVTITPSVTVTITPSVTNTPVVTPTPDVKGETDVFGFSLRKSINGKTTYRVGEPITFTVSMENTGTETVETIHMRDIYSTNMRVEAIYLLQNGQRRNVTSQFFANPSEQEGGNIMPRDPQDKNKALDLTDFTGDLKPGESLVFEFIFKSTSRNSQVCNQAHASANKRTEISSQKVCVTVDAVVPVTD